MYTHVSFLTFAYILRGVKSHDIIIPIIWYLKTIQLLLLDGADSSSGVMDAVVVTLTLWTSKENVISSIERIGIVYSAEIPETMYYTFNHSK